MCRYFEGRSQFMNRVTDREVWIESDVPLADTPLWTVPLRLVKAVVDGEAANLGSVPPLLASNLETIRDIYAAWIPGHKIPLDFELSSDVAVPEKCVSLFFSGGVDSFFSLIKHRDEIDNLVLIHGFDIPLAETKTFELALEQAQEAARLFGKRLIVVRTNLHWEESRLYEGAPRIPCGWGMYHGAALAAVAHALTPSHGKIFIASSFSYADLHPWGSHPLLDPLWSTEAVQIVHDGGETRTDKLRVLVQYPEALTRLRVCWENLGEYNCGLCEKCVRTMLGLRALGVDHCAAFPDTLTPELVRQQGLEQNAALYWRELLGAGLPPPFQAAVQSAIHSYDNGLPPRTGKWKREIKRWLYAARNAGRALMAPIDRS
jgi:7-cyano-7-deazaguanine synthase in queuosine biosynthesis